MKAQRQALHGHVDMGVIRDELPINLGYQPGMIGDVQEGNTGSSRFARTVSAQQLKTENDDVQTAIIALRKVCASAYSVNIRRNCHSRTLSDTLDGVNAMMHGAVCIHALSTHTEHADPADNPGGIYHLIDCLCLRCCGHGVDQDGVPSQSHGPREPKCHCGSLVEHFCRTWRGCRTGTHRTDPTNTCQLQSDCSAHLPC